MLGSVIDFVGMSLTPTEIDKMREVCRLAAKTLKFIEPYVKPGVTTNELDKLVHDFTLENGAVPAPLNYHGFPKSICTSVNFCICHGVPDDTPLKDGDVLNIDVTPQKDGFFGDTSSMFFVGEVKESAKKVTECAQEAMWKGIEAIAPFGTTGDIGFAIGKFVQKKGYSAVKEIGGHGIGKVFHTDPFVPSFGKRGRGERLKPWTCITVEPMINQTSDKIVEMPIANSSIKYYETHDKSLSAQFEHTVLITDTSYEVLTLLED